MLDDMFAPLPADQTGAPASGAVKPTKTPIVPVPSNAPAFSFQHPKFGEPSKIWPYHTPAGLAGYAARFDFVGEDGEPGKDVLPITFCDLGSGKRGWRAKAVPEPRPPYKLPELLARPEAGLLFVEGEKAADAAALLFPELVSTTTMGGAKAPKKSDWSQVKGRHLSVWPDNDDVGRAYANEVAELALAAGAASVRIVQVPPDWPEGWDSADMLPEGVTEADLERLVTDARLFTDDSAADPPLDDDAEIARLAKLPPLAYEREREGAAKALGVRTSVLDKLVKAERGSESDNAGQGQALILPSPEPWSYPVAGVALLNELTAGISKYVVMETGAAEAVALWVIHAHLIDAFPISPRLAVTSPEKGCGKTTSLDMIARLVPRPLTTANTTAAAIFRTIEALKPTLLIDEADTFLTENDEMRGVLNSGHRRSGAFVLRLVGDDHEPRAFSTWAPTVIAMIGRLPDTLEDRSIPVRLRRKLPNETVAPLRADHTPDLDIEAEFTEISADGVGDRQRPAVAVEAGDLGDMAERVGHLNPVAFGVIGVLGHVRHVGARTVHRQHLALSGVGVGPTAALAIGRHRLGLEIAIRIVAEFGHPVRLGDLGRQMPGRVPGRLDRAHPRAFNALGLQAAGVVGVGADIAVEVGAAGQEAVAVITQ
jgi:hypothetical protein